MTCKRPRLTRRARQHGGAAARQCSSCDALSVLPPHVHAVADQARRMIVSEKKDILRCQCGRALEGHRAAAVRPSWVGCSRLPSIHWARLHLQHHQPMAQVRRDSPLQHYSHFLFTSVLCTRFPIALQPAHRSACACTRAAPLICVPSVTQVPLRDDGLELIVAAISLGLRRMVRRARCPT